LAQKVIHENIYHAFLLLLNQQ